MYPFFPSARGFRWCLAKWYDFLGFLGLLTWLSIACCVFYSLIGLFDCLFLWILLYWLVFFCDSLYFVLWETCFLVFGVVGCNLNYYWLYFGCQARLTFFRGSSPWRGLIFPSPYPFIFIGARPVTLEFLGPGFKHADFCPSNWWLSVIMTYDVGFLALSTCLASLC